MAVTDTNTMAGPFIGNGSSTVFPFTFVALSPDEVSVIVDDYTLPTGSYSVNLDDKTVVLTVPPSLGARLFIISDPSFEQQIQFENGSRWLADPVNEANDRAAIRAIWLRDRVARAPLAPLQPEDAAGLFPTIGDDGQWVFTPAGPGATGSSDNTYSSLTAFKASDISRLTASLVGAPGVVDGRFNWTPGNFTGQADDKIIVKADSTPLSQGAWVRQAAEGVNFDGRSVRAKLLESVSITDARFGASTSSLDNSAAIQAAFDAAQRVYIPEGVFLVKTSTHPGLPGTFGDSSVCLKPHSGLEVYGPGVLKLADNAWATSGAIIGNWDGVAVENIVIKCQIDGNIANNSVPQGIAGMSGIVIVHGTNCTVEDGIVQNCSFNGVQFAKGSVSCTVQGMRVDNIGYIGIQFQQADAGKVLFNKLVSCVDNAIDLEANNGTQTRNVIIGNTTKGCATGVFLESGGDTIVMGNITEDTNEAGVWLNRINNGAENCIIANNTFRKGAGIGNRGGIYINNVCGKSIVHDNKFDGFEKAIICEGATNYLQIHDCYFKNITQLLISASRQTSALLKSHAYNLHYEGPLSGPAGQERFPYTYSPSTNPANFSDRDFNVTVESTWNLDAGGRRAATAEDEYRTGASGNLDANGAWGSAYAIFNSGETLVYETGTAMTVGNYVLINGATYLVFGTGGAGEFKLRSAAGVAGDYTAALNSNYGWVEYWPEWQTF